MSNIQAQLLVLKRKYRLSTSDLAVLLESNRSTVLSWEKGAIPSDTRVDLVQEKINNVHKAAEKFPVPLAVTQYERKQYLTDAVENGRASKLSKPRTPTRGARS